MNLETLFRVLWEARTYPSAEEEHDVRVAQAHHHAHLPLEVGQSCLVRAQKHLGAHLRAVPAGAVRGPLRALGHALGNLQLAQVNGPLVQLLRHLGAGKQIR